MLDCNPPLDYFAIDRFVTFAGRPVKPMVQTDVHIPQNEDFNKKKDTLQRYVEGWDKFDCKLTNMYEGSTAECFGFLRLALVDHTTLEAMSSLPMVRQLKKIIPLWVENEKDVLTYLSLRLDEYKEQFNNSLWEDELALADMRENGEVVSEEFTELQKRVGARVIVEYWQRIAEVMKKIFDTLDSKSVATGDLKHFSTPKEFALWLASELHLANTRFTFDTHSQEFARLFESYFIDQTGIYQMIQEEMEAIQEQKLKMSLRQKNKRF